MAGSLLCTRGILFRLDNKHNGHSPARIKFRLNGFRASQQHTSALVLIYFSSVSSARLLGALSVFYRSRPRHTPHTNAPPYTHKHTHTHRATPEKENKSALSSASSSSGERKARGGSPAKTAPLSSHQVARPGHAQLVLISTRRPTSKQVRPTN